jgi:hypothetical protein
LESNCRTVCYYAYYNLAKYFYSNGYDGIAKNSEKYVSYLEIACKGNVFMALVELFYIYCGKYLNNRLDEDKSKIYYYKDLIENHNEYTDEIKLKIENELCNIKPIDKIDIECIVND